MRLVKLIVAQTKLNILVSLSGPTFGSQRRLDTLDDDERPSDSATQRQIDER